MAGLDIQFRYRFEAAHRFVGGATPCSTPHGHSWHATLVMSPNIAELNNNRMAEEFSKLKAPWKKFIGECADHSFFVDEKDPLITPMKQAIEGVRLLVCPGTPTTELLALLFFRKALHLYKESNLRPTALILDETPTNTVRLERSALESLELNFGDTLQEPTAWWNSLDPLAR